MDKLLEATPTLYGEDAKSVLKETFEVSPEQLEKSKRKIREGCSNLF